MAVVQFRSDYAVGGRGFLVHWHSLLLQDTYEYEQESGTIQSINFLNDYISDLHYNISITVSPNSRILLEFAFLWLDDTFSNCSDYLSVILGEEESDRVKLCASDTNNNSFIRFLSKQRVMFLEFHTDSYGTSRGFVANYSSGNLHILPTNSLRRYLIKARTCTQLQLK